MDQIWWLLLTFLVCYFTFKGMNLLDRKVNVDRQRFIDSLEEDGSIFIVDKDLFISSTLDHKSVAKLKAISGRIGLMRVRVESEISANEYSTLNKFLLKFPVLKNDLVNLDIVTDKTFAQISAKYHDLLKQEARASCLKGVVSRN